MQVQLRGKPGSRVTIKIIQAVQGDGAKVLGSQGGSLEVINTSSPLFGVRVEIPENALPTEAIISISVQNTPLPEPLPEGVLQEGSVISFNSTNPIFLKPIKIKIPFEGERTEDELRLVYTYDELTQKWVTVPPSPTLDPSFFVAFIDHFSIYTKGKVVITDTKIESGFKLGIDTLRFNNTGYPENNKCTFDPDNKGVCAGIALLATTYFNGWAATANESLMCRWDQQTSAAAACIAHGEYLAGHGCQNWGCLITSWDEIWNGILEMPYSWGDLDYSYLVDFIKEKARKNIVVPISMREGTNGHEVVAYGWRKTGWFSGEILIYNVNYNNRYEVMKYHYDGPFLRIEYTDPENTKWGYFFFDRHNLDLNIGRIIFTYDETDRDGDGIGDGGGGYGNCDNCPNTYNPNQVDSNNNGIGDACDTTPGGSFRLPDTGQTSCYDMSGNVISCAGTGQDGAYNINPMSFTDNGNGTVTDNNTGLIWQKEDDNTTHNWYQASGTFDATYNPSSQNVCGSLALGGHSDWRLPTKKELVSIVNCGVPYPGPEIDTTYFPNTKSSRYWSSTTGAYDPDIAWCVGFDGSDVNCYYKFFSSSGGSPDNSYYVRCVRGQSSSQNLTDNGNGTITDHRTGLIWQQVWAGAMTWSSALSYCEGLYLGGRSDWRLPNFKEIESLPDERYYPVLNTNFFPFAYASQYWSSTTFDRISAWCVDLEWYGMVASYIKYTGFGVRCVCGGYQ